MQKEHKIWWEELAEAYRTLPEKDNTNLNHYSCDIMFADYQEYLGFDREYVIHSDQDMYAVLKKVWTEEYGNADFPISAHMGNAEEREAFVQDLADYIERNVA
jgi:hypothetical protein